MLTSTLNHALWVVQKFYCTTSPANCKRVGDADNGIYVSREPMTETMKLSREKSHSAGNQI